MQDVCQVIFCKALSSFVLNHNFPISGAHKVCILVCMRAGLFWYGGDEGSR